MSVFLAKAHLEPFMRYSLTVSAFPKLPEKDVKIVSLRLNRELHLMGKPLL